MNLRRAALMVAAVVACAAAAAACGIGPGPARGGDATLTVTRDYGAEDVIDVTLDDLGAGDTVMRALDREAEITTRYGGGFVQSIDGIEGGTDGGRSFDWFFYVNGIESPVGAAEAELGPGDRIWWDHHDWTDVMRVPAVVGAFPQPFQSVFDDRGEPIEIGCAAEGSPCDVARAALEQEGIDAEVVDLAEAEPGPRPRLLVGELDRLAGDRVANLLHEGPQASGVYARPAADGSELELLDEGLQVRERGDFGLVAATASGDQAPTWVVTATDGGPLALAADLLGGGLLHNRFALAVDANGETIPVPAR